MIVLQYLSYLIIKKVRLPRKVHISGEIVFGNEGRGVGGGGWQGGGGIKKTVSVIVCCYFHSSDKNNWQFNAPVCTKAHAADNSKSHFWREIIDLFSYFVMENMLLHHTLFFS